jgi:16S rRNA (cytidine1402-2'-O)-methyltransferase
VSIESAALYVVATPIGNLEDITRRALSTLQSVDVILAEDTRHSTKLLRHYGIKKPLLSLHEHNERARVPEVLARLARGERVALVSDAGTPLISDPGLHLVQGVRAGGYPVIPIPGPSALLCALSVAGLPTDRFVFEGFLPARAAARRARLQTLAGETRTLVLFEAPHRIEATLGDLARTLGGERPAVLARELTKMFETVRPGTLAELSAWVREQPEQRRGEFVLVVHGAADAPPGAPDAERVLRVLVEVLPLGRAVSAAARITGHRRGELYRRALSLRGEGEGQ